MCTAVVGGSIQRAATSISTANNQTSPTPMRKHRKMNRTETAGRGVAGGASGFSVTPQNNRLRSIDIAPDASVHPKNPARTRNIPGKRVHQPPDQTRSLHIASLASSLTSLRHTVGSALIVRG